MEENLNQDLTDTQGLFDDYSEDNTEVEEPVKGETTKEEPTKVAEKETDTTKVEPFLDIVYNKETKNLSKEEARTLAQKGMNYDHLKERYAPIEELARLNGMDVTTFINSLNDTQMHFELEKEMNSLRQQFPDTNEEVLKELAQSRAQGRVATQIAKFHEEQQATVNAVDEQVHRDLEMFKQEFPDVDFTELPNEVMDNVRNGLPLVSAYYKYLRVQDANKHEIDQQNKVNQTKALGDTSNAGGGEKDAFLSGLNSF